MAREKFPDLIDLSPKKQLDSLPSLLKGKCGKRNRSCSTHGGGCGYRFKKGDKHWVCPKCGADRRCWSSRVSKKRACRMHGANGGRPPSPESKKRMILEKIKGYNAVLDSPDLLTNTQNIAAVQAMSLHLIEEMTEHDQSILLDDLNRAIRMMAGSMRVGNQSRLQAGMDMALEAMAPLQNARSLRFEFYETVKIHNLLVNNQLKWAMENRQMVPWVQVVEFMSIFHRFMFKYLPNVSDRTNFLKDIRPYFAFSDDDKDEDA